MNDRFWFRLAAGLLIAGALVSAGYYGYNLGVVRGLEQGAALAERGANAPVIIYGRPWGFGFGFFPFFPLLFIFFWVFVARRMFWGGPWRRGTSEDQRRA